LSRFSLCKSRWHSIIWQNSQDNKPLALYRYYRYTIAMTQAAIDVHGQDFDFMLNVIKSPACKGRSAEEAMDYAKSLIEIDRSFPASEWDERKVWREIVTSSACAGRTLPEVIEYAKPFVAIEHDRQEIKINEWRKKWDREERRNSRIKSIAFSRPTMFISISALFFAFYRYVALYHPLTAIITAIGLAAWFDFWLRSKSATNLRAAIVKRFKF
jgi:hypothetical protein